MEIIQKLIIIGFYVLAAIIGLLCVAYHLFGIWYSSLDGDPWSVLGIILALGNLIYPVCILLLLTMRPLKPYAYQPKVFLAVLLMIPIILYLNYKLVESFSPYNYQS